MDIFTYHNFKTLISSLDGSNWLFKKVARVDDTCKLCCLYVYSYAHYFVSIYRFTSFFALLVSLPNGDILEKVSYSKYDDFSLDQIKKRLSYMYSINLR